MFVKQLIFMAAKLEILIRFKKKKTIEEIQEDEEMLQSMRAISNDPTQITEDSLVQDRYVYDLGVITLTENTIFNRLDEDHTTVRDAFWQLTIKCPYEEFKNIYSELTLSPIATTVQIIE